MTGPPDLFLPAAPDPEQDFLWLENRVASQAFGAQSAPGGDFDGDGRADLLLGSPGASGQRPVIGAAYLLLGRAGLLASEPVEFPNAGEVAIRFIESPPSVGLGAFVDGGFDWDGDGTSDVLIANKKDTVYIVMGGSPEPGRFVRGDVNDDGGVDLSDAVSVLSFLFLGGPPPFCEDAADADDAGSLEITDAVYLLNYLFLGGRPPPAPFPDRGTDGTPDALAECRP